MTLWTAHEIAAACGGEAVGDWSADDVTFDSREAGPGTLFVALKGETTDGHRFVPQALTQGAAGVLVDQAVDGPHVRVADTTAALDALGQASRARTDAKVVGVTGSVGKTGTKEALWAAFDRMAEGRVHRSLKSYNNHVGVPLSLARMPRDSRFAVLEMGMNHAGELAGLTRLVRPHVAIVTAIAPAHTAFFSGEEAIADAKGEIFEGLEPGGTAVVPFDSPHRDRLMAKAQQHAERVVTFGTGKGADVRAVEWLRAANGGSFVSARLSRGREVSFTVAHPGEHWVSNSLAVLAAVEAVGGDLGLAGLALAELGGLPGRGRHVVVPVRGGEALIIDESYNANPASMRATLKVLAAQPATRRLAVLGEMRELGEGSATYHADLAGPVAEAGVEYAVLVGEGMEPLARALAGRVQSVHVADAAQARDRLIEMLAPGDAVLVKGSNAIGLSAVVEAVSAPGTPCFT